MDNTRKRVVSKEEMRRVKVKQNEYKLSNKICCIENKVSMCTMIEKSVQYFTKKEENFINLLIETGVRKMDAKIIVYLANNPGSTFRDLEHMLDRRQSDVSIALKKLEDSGWIKTWRIKTGARGNWLKKHSLAMPINDLISIIGEQKKKEVCKRVDLIKKIQDYL